MTPRGRLLFVATLACLAPASMFMGALGLPAILYSFMPSPAMDIHTITDGRRTVTFISMMHVASPGFYDRVRERIRSEGARGASYLWEGLDFDGGGTVPPSKAAFDRMLERRSATAEASGLVVQPQETFFGLTGRPDVWADLDASSLPERDEVLARGEGANVLVDAAMDAYIWCEGHVVSLARRFPNGPVSSLYGRQQRYALATVPKPADAEPANSAWSGPRERRLKDVVDSTAGNVVITYGAAHYPGFKALLGPGWREVSVERNPLFE